MLLYTVNIELEQSIRQDWLEWMTSKHIPDVMGTGLFLSWELCEDTENNLTYRVIYKCESNEKLDEYLANYAPALRDEHTKDMKESLRRPERFCQ
jgi:hypothetical protein